MSFMGTVEDGKVTLPPELNVPSGTKVRVEIVESSLVSEPVGRKLKALDGAGSGLPDDLAKNHDHYLHGKSKR